MDLIKKTIFITGGCGFIGTSLALALAEQNEVILFDNERRNAFQFSPLVNNPKVRFIRGDVLERAELKHAMPDAVDLVIHCAAITGASTYAEQPLLTLNTNILGTLNVLEVVREKKVGLFVNFSSSEIYGKEAQNVNEKCSAVIDPVIDLRWSYAISKVAGESYAFAYMHEYGVPVVTVRPCNIYGPYQVGEGAIHSIIERALKNEPVTIYGDGNQTRSWCYIDDFVAALFSIIRLQLAGEIFNIGNYDQYYTINELANRIVALTGSKSSLIYEPLTYADVCHRRPEIEKLKNATGFVSSYSLDAGLTKTIDWYRSLGSQAK